MPDTLPVHVNRESLHSLEVQPSFETDGPFDVQLINHGEPVHVHLHLDDSLSEFAAIEAPNHHVDGESARPVRVTVDRAEPVRGSLKIATSYGAETRYVDVELVRPSETEESVQVDESLGKPQAPSDSSSGDGGPVPAANTERLSVPVIGLGIVAVSLAVLVAAILGGLVAWVGALVVAVAVAAAVVLLVSGER